MAVEASFQPWTAWLILRALRAMPFNVFEKSTKI
jgi:hypothetical protein